jgi:hypothetical protein
VSARLEQKEFDPEPSANLGAMNERRRAQLGLLARALFGAAIIVLVLSMVGAIQVATSDSDILFFGDVQRENRPALAIATLGSGAFADGLLAALKGVLILLLDWREG